MPRGLGPIDPNTRIGGPHPRTRPVGASPKILDRIRLETSAENRGERALDLFAAPTKMQGVMRALALITLLAASHAMVLSANPTIATPSPKASAGAGMLRLKGGKPVVERCTSGAEGDGKVHSDSHPLSKIIVILFWSKLYRGLDTLAWI